MPLRPEVRKLYGPKHRKLRADLIAIYGEICQKCRQRHPRVNLAHLNHDVLDVRAVTLLCPTCHAKHDTGQRVAMTRRRRARKTGQLWLDPAVEWAPYPAWEIPDRVRDRATQLSLLQ